MPPESRRFGLPDPTVLAAHLEVTLASQVWQRAGSDFQFSYGGIMERVAQVGGPHHSSREHQALEAPVVSTVVSKRFGARGSLQWQLDASEVRINASFDIRPSALQGGRPGKGRRPQRLEWVAVGLTTKHGMIAADIALLTRDGQLGDYHTRGYGPVHKDARQSLRLLAYNWEDLGHAQRAWFHFHRDRDTGDPDDLAIESTPITVLWAVGTSPDLRRKHSSAWELPKVDFFRGGSPATVEPSSHTSQVRCAQVLGSMLELQHNAVQRAQMLLGLDDTALPLPPRDSAIASLVRTGQYRQDELWVDGSCVDLRSWTGDRSALADGGDRGDGTRGHGDGAARGRGRTPVQDYLASFQREEWCGDVFNGGCAMAQAAARVVPLVKAHEEWALRLERTTSDFWVARGLKRICEAQAVNVRFAPNERHPLALGDGPALTPDFKLTLCRASAGGHFFGFRNYQTWLLAAALT